MSIWKNTEVRRTALWLLLATAVGSVAAALLYPACGLLTLGLGAVCGAIWYGSTRRRYRELARKSRDKDRIHHGQAQQMLPQQEEGEQAILVFSDAHGSLHISLYGTHYSLYGFESREGQRGQGFGVSLRRQVLS